MSKTIFPDIIGPSYVSANGLAPVLVRGGKLHVIGSGAASDNPGARRTDLTLTGALFSTVSASIGAPGEWQPTITNLAAADLVRVSSSVSGAILTGMDGATPTRLNKFVANIGTLGITIQPPASIVGGHAYFVNAVPYTLQPNEVVRASYDSVSGVYRIKGYVAPPSNYLVINGDHVVINANKLYVV